MSATFEESWKEARVAKKPDVAQKAIDSIGKPKKRPVFETEKKLAKMSGEEWLKRRKEFLRK